VISGCRKYTWLESADTGVTTGNFDRRCTALIRTLVPENRKSPDMPKRTDSPGDIIRSSLRKSGTYARKSLGQNFLVDESLLPVIVEAAELSPRDNVVEIGPGLGTLTAHLLLYAGHVTAVELDDKLAAELRKKFASNRNIDIINKDILKTSLQEIIGDAPSYKVVANLPYNITSPVLNYFTSAAKKPELMVIMIQKEVAEAITAMHGNLNVLAIGIQLLTRPRIVKLVPPQSFYPAPKVDSAIVRLDFLEKPAVKVDDIDSFLKFVKRCFHSPRKTVHNSIQLGLHIGAAVAEQMLEAARIEGRKRPGELTLQEWQKLYLESKNEEAAPQ
jgi:16S rRNA (adenine1518-N6/adenine1519-N6)-dimethyltransferase